MTEEYGHLPDGFFLSQQEIENLRKSKKELTEYAREKLKKLLDGQKKGKDINNSTLKSICKMDAQELRNLQEAYMEVVENQQLGEAEGSYGQTPRARKAYIDLANKRRSTPASEYSKRGEKKEKVDSAETHFYRTGNPDAGNRGKKSTKPSFHSGARKGMTQKDRDYSRGEAEYGHTGYDPDFDGGPSAPGGKPKGKKLERQKKTGVSAESYDIYDIILSHLLDEGYAETPEAAEVIMVNMSEDWRDSIIG